MLVSPVITDIDRQWALSKCPDWATRGALDFEPELEPDPDAPAVKAKPLLLNWDMFVADQIERFERYFLDQRKTREEWSTLWRKSWWPKADPAILHPKRVPKSASPHPVFREGTPEFARALAVATPGERRIWNKLGLAQFKPADARLARVVKAEARAIRNPAGDQ